MNKPEMRKAEFLACLSGISWQIRVNKISMAFIQALNISAWLLSIFSLILILACIMQFYFMPVKLVLMLSGVLAVFCLATVIYFLFKPVSALHCIELADSRTNRYNLIQNAYECCLAGRDTPFARATIESGFELLKQNKDISLSLPYKRPGVIILIPLLLIGVLTVLPAHDLSGDMAGKTVEAGLVLTAEDDVLIERHDYYLSEKGQNKSVNASLPAKSFISADFLYYVENLKNGSGHSFGYNIFNNDLSGNEYGLMHSFSGGLSSSKNENYLAQEQSSVSDVSAENNRDLLSDIDGEFDSDFFFPGELEGSPAMATDLMAAGRSGYTAKSNKSSDARIDNKSSGILQREARPYLSDKLEEPVRSLGFVNNKKDYFQKGYGGIVLEKRPKPDAYGIGGEPLSVYLKGISQNGNEQMVNGSVPGGEFELKYMESGKAVSALPKQPVDNPIISEQWLDISKEYLKLVRQGIELKDKQ